MISHANRGRGLEELLELINNIYRQKCIAMIHKVPTAWIPIRDRRGKIATAKVEKKASVDFLGVYEGRGLAFDAKHTTGSRIRWDRLEIHQMDFLDMWQEAGGLSFVLVGFGLEQLYVVPWDWWKRGYKRRQKGKGMASFTAKDLDRAWFVTPDRVPLDYLKILTKGDGRHGSQTRTGAASKAGEKSTDGKTATRAMG